MADKTFTVAHPKHPYPLTVTGKTLEEALQNEALDPHTWTEVPPPPNQAKEDSGQTD